MSVQAMPAAKSVNLFFDALPNDAITSVFEFLKNENGSLSVRGEADDKAVLATAAVCQSWRDNHTLIAERKEAFTRLHQRINLQGVHREMLLLNKYPPEMVRLFRNSRTPISQLPVLDLGDRQGLTDHIDFLQPEEMDRPVMRFQDCFQRPGVALKIRANASFLRRQHLSEIFSDMRRAVQQRNLSRVIYNLIRMGIVFHITYQTPEIVLAIFKRYNKPESKQWSRGWGNGDNTIEHLYFQRHKENGCLDLIAGVCQNCPFDGPHVNETVLSSLLNGQDPDFSLPERNGVRSENQVAARGRRGLSEKTILATALAAITIAYFVNYYLAREQS